MATQPPLAGAVGGIDPQGFHLPATALSKAFEDLDRGGLAGSVGPEQGEHLTLLHFEADIAYRLLVAV